MEPLTVITTYDRVAADTRAINQALHDVTSGSIVITNPQGAHALVVGLDARLEVTIEGSVGYYCAGMNKQATVVINGNAGTGLAENIMSGTVRVAGNASQAAAASGHGGLVVIEGDASGRCGISMKGVDIVVGGDIGHLSAFMAQSGNLVVLGNAGADLGDSLYEACLFVRGSVESLGADCVEKEVSAEHLQIVGGLLTAADMNADPADFRRYGSARALYNFHVDDLDSDPKGGDR